MMRNRVEAKRKDGLGAALDSTNGNTMNDLSKEEITMTSRKFSRKRIVQALGLLALGLALLVGSAEYGNADFGRTGGEPSIMTVAQEEERPAIFVVVAVVNARGGLEVRLTAIPGSPTLSIQFVVRGDTNPHRLVDPGTRITLLGVAKKGVTAFRSAEDIARLTFFARVPKATAASTDSTMQDPAQVTFLLARVTQLILGGPTIQLPQNKVLLVQDGPLPPISWYADEYFGCCERKVRYRLDDKGKPRKPFNGSGSRNFLKEENVTVIRISFDVELIWECDPNKNQENLCRGTLSARVYEHPETVVEDPENRKGPLRPHPLTFITVDKVSKEEEVKCKDAVGSYTATMRVTYSAAFEGRVQVMGPLTIDVFVWEVEKGDLRDVVFVHFVTDKKKEDFGVGIIVYPWK